MPQIKLVPLIILALLLAIAPAAWAQGECQAILTQAYASLEDACDFTEAGFACYGHGSIDATGLAGAADFTLAEAGDMVDLGLVERLQTLPMSVGDETWGLAWMQVKAGREQQPTALLLLGDTHLSSAAQPILERPATASANVNIRRRPTTSSTVIDSLANEETVTANGRLADNSWIRIRVEGDSRGEGWVSGDFLEVEGGAEALTVVEADVPVYAAMQVTFLLTGLDDRPCDAAPDSGLLAQTPEGSDSRLTINGTEIRLNSTAFLQADDSTLFIYLLEGSGSVTAYAVTQPLLAGTVVSIPLAEGGNTPAGPPEKPQPYDGEALANLPLSLSPLRPVTAAEPLTPEEIDAILTPEGAPLAGRWIVSGTQGICVASDGSGKTYVTSKLIFGTGRITVEPEGARFTFDGTSGETIHRRAGTGSYVYDGYSPDDPTLQETFRTTVESPTSMTTSLNANSYAGPCNPTDGSATWAWVGK